MSGEIEPWKGMECRFIGSKPGAGLLFIISTALTKFKLPLLHSISAVVMQY